jgi:lincosamide nucleotidyltransferase A/C/D/E
VAMEARDVLDVLTILREAQVERLWLDGGWGIDALLGAQHRDHDDLDLVAAIDDVDRIVEALGDVGFTISEDVRPTRVVLADRAGRTVDLHLVRIDAAGTGWQTGAGPDGTDAKYPAGGFTSGWVGGQTVDCIGPEVQLDHHLGYEPTAVDREDVVRLCERFTIPLPDEYK